MDKETLFATRKVVAAKVAPTGEKIAYVGARDSRSMNIHVTRDLSIDSSEQLTNFSEADIIQFFWTQDSTKVIFIKDHLGKGMHHIYGVDLKKKTVTDYTKSYTAHARLYHMSPDQNKAVIGLNHRNRSLHDLYLLDFDTGNITLFYENRGYHKFLFTDGLDIALKIQVLADGSWRVFSKDEKVLLELSVDDTFHSDFLRYDQENDCIYFLDTRESDTTQLKALFLKSVNLTKLIADPKVSDVDSVLFMHNRPVAYSSCYFFKKWHLLDKSFAEDFQRIEKQIGEQFDIVNQDKAGQKWLLATNAPEIGPEFWLYDRNEKSCAHLYREYDDADFSKMYPLKVKTEDGFELVCYYSLPKKYDVDGKVEKPIPLVVMPHGGPFKVRDYYGFNPYCQWLSHCGYAVLLVNFRLSSGLGKKLACAGNSQWGKKAHQDVLDAVNACIEQKITEKDKIAIFGGSYGGYEALSACAFSPDFFTCSVAFCGPSNLQTVLSAVPNYWEWTLKPLSDHFGFFTKQAFIKSMGGDPETEEGKKYLASASPIHFVDQMTTPLLLAHGIHDHIVPEAESREIYQKLSANSKKVIYLLFTDEGHRIYEYRNKIALFNEVEKFLSNYLHGTYTPCHEGLKCESSIKTVN